MRTQSSSRLGWLLLAGIAGAAAAIVLARASPPPAADVGRGSEDAFVGGLHAREIPPRGRPQRWTRERAVASFRHLPAGPATVEVALHGHRGPVIVSADGVVIGSLDPGVRSATFAVPGGPRPVREIELRASAFRAGDGRLLGTLLDRVSVRTRRAPWPGPGLLTLAVIPALAMAGFAMIAGASGWLAAAGGAATAALQAAILRPNGVAYSPYAARLAILLVAIAGVCGLWGAFWNRRRAGSGPWAFVALAAASVVQVVVGASPLMVVSDAVFHANNLARVSSGDLFLTSMTQHATPFRFPYGVSFYVPLVPLLRAGFEGVALVRWGAGVAGLAAAAGLFGALASRGPRLAAAAVVVMELLPGTIDALSFGNLSNAFAQAVTVLFLAWWVGRARGSWAAGALLVAVAATAHLSAFIVLAVVGPWLGWARWPGIRSDRTRALALLVGLAAAVAYYASFASLVLGQLGRLGEGGGPAAGSGLWDVLVRQAGAVLAQWGLPAMLLACLGAPRPGRGGLDRDLVAWWGAALVLLVLAMGTPLDVRWVFALGPVLATASAFGAAALGARGAAGRAAAGVLLAVHAALGGWTAAGALWARYR